MFFCKPDRPDTFVGGSLMGRLNPAEFGPKQVPGMGAEKVVWGWVGGGHPSQTYQGDVVDLMGDPS